MRTVVFIHGTGVREPVYTKSFNLVQSALNERLGAPNVRVETCYWGGKCGATLGMNALSIPEADTSRAAGGESLDEEYELALRGLLYDDPFAELELLALQHDATETPPGREPPGFELFQAVLSLMAAPEVLAPEQRLKLSALLAGTGLGAHFDVACGEIAATYRAVIENAVGPLSQYRFAIARAIIARCAQLCRDTGEPHYVAAAPTGTEHDRIVELIAAALGGRDLAAANWVKEKVGRLIARVATRRFRRRRGRYSEHFAPFGADVIVYQTRPQAIREFIRDTIATASAQARTRGESGELALIGHSLGGIAAFDTVIENPLPMVRQLITVGSQVPLLYELDALSGLRLRRDAVGEVPPPPHPLPPGFPPWLNVYDPRDFLSYRAEPIFGAAYVRDTEVDNGEPFPESHSAYWRNHKVWDAVVHHLNAEQSDA